jgi:hypothetical protein
VKKIKELISKFFWVIFLIIFVGIPIILGILSVLGVGTNAFSLIADVFASLSDGNWLQGVAYTLFVIIGSINALRGMVTLSSREQDHFANLPGWVQQIITGLSFIGTIGFIIIFFERLL